MPTVLQALKVDTPAQVQGRSLLPLMTAKTEEESRSIYAETFLPRLHFNWSELRSVETEKYQLIEAPKPELYDLSRDPGETQNLYAAKNAVAGELRGRLEGKILPCTPDQALAGNKGGCPALCGEL